tara:strand:- start:444 stop:710 length:267 start_codon:yes stop_codon:yes gene_type:complete
MENEKKYYYKTDYKGCMPSIDGHRFHPWIFYATQKEYDEIYDNYLSRREDEFKIIGVHKFETYEEFEFHFPIFTYDNQKTLNDLKNAR